MPLPPSHLHRWERCSTFLIVHTQKALKLSAAFSCGKPLNEVFLWFAGYFCCCFQVLCIEQRCVLLHWLVSWGHKASIITDSAVALGIGGAGVEDLDLMWKELWWVFLQFKSAINDHLFTSFFDVLNRLQQGYQIWHSCVSWMSWRSWRP